MTSTELQEDIAYYLKFCLLVQDDTMKTNATCYPILIDSSMGKGVEFIELGLDKQPPSEKHFKKLKYIYRLLTRAWAHLEAIVEVVSIVDNQPMLQLVDTAIIS